MYITVESWLRSKPNISFVKDLRRSLAPQACIRLIKQLHNRELHGSCGSIRGTEVHE